MNLFSSHFADESQCLKVHEWLAVVLLIGLVGGLAIVTSGAPASLNQDKYIPKDGLEVFVKGSVEFPGVYYMPVEMPLKEILDMAQVSADGDLRKFNLETIVRRGRVIKVPSRLMISVFVKGAVEHSGIIRVPKGSRLEDLPKFVKLTPNANTLKLKRKRKLKDNEVVEVSEM